MGFLSRISRQREFMIFVVILGMFIGMSFASPVFLSRGNLMAMALAMSIEVLIGVAMVNLMVSGGFDMSVGSVVGFTGAGVAALMRAGIPIPIAIVAGLLLGACVGAINGFIVAKIGINPFITTLAGLSLYRGLTLIVTQGRNISGLPETFTAIGQNSFLGLQMPIWYALIFVIVGDIMLRKSRFFRRNYYIGGSEKSALLSGIQVDKMKIFNYMLTGFFAAMAGIILASRLGTASTTAGTGLELRVITAVIIGGASLQGGEGTVLGVFFGSLLMAMIANALTLLGVDIYWQTFVIGATLLTAVFIDRYGKIRRERKTVIDKNIKSSQQK